MNRLFRPTLARRSWPPESPAKSYLKVSFFRVAALLLLKGYECLRRKFAEIPPFVNPLGRI